VLGEYVVMDTMRTYLYYEKTHLIEKGKERGMNLLTLELSQICGWRTREGSSEHERVDARAYPK